MFKPDFIYFLKKCKNVKKDVDKIKNLCYHIEVVKRTATNGRVVELVDSLDSGSSVHCGRAGSSPASPTKNKKDIQMDVLFIFDWMD